MEENNQKIPKQWKIITEFKKKPTMLKNCGSREKDAHTQGPKEPLFSLHPLLVIQEHQRYTRVFTDTSTHTDQGVASYCFLQKLDF